MSLASGEKLPSPVGDKSSSLLNTWTAMGSGPAQLSTALAVSPTFTRSWLGGQSRGVATEQKTFGGSLSSTFTEKPQAGAAHGSGP